MVVAAALLDRLLHHAIVIEITKELGQIKDYAIYSNQYGSSDDFDLVLVVEMEGTDDIAPNREALIC